MLQSSGEAYAAAEKTVESVAELLDMLASVKPFTKEWIQVAQQISACVRPAMYLHFESREGAPKLYMVHGVSFAASEEATPPLVAYTAVSDGVGAGLCFHGPLLGEGGFLTPVKQCAYMGPRFVALSAVRERDVGEALHGVHAMASCTS